MPYALLPEWDCLPFDRVSPSRATMGLRTGVLRWLTDRANLPRILLTTPPALIQRVPPPGTWTAAHREFRAGDAIVPVMHQPISTGLAPFAPDTVRAALRRERRRGGRSFVVCRGHRLIATAAGGDPAAGLDRARTFLDALEAPPEGSRARSSARAAA
ncbi:hypothetical protein [Methylobacterium organophilum]|uniref:hypothetical protein n=1 Tax=Methylobacterium organophilum TaxID=410 RepID=UPI003B846F1E